MMLSAEGWWRMPACTIYAIDLPSCNDMLLHLGFILYVLWCAGRRSS
jgi:hypothetical protein